MKIKKKINEIIFNVVDYVRFVFHKKEIYEYIVNINHKSKWLTIYRYYDRFNKSYIYFAGKDDHYICESLKEAKKRLEERGRGKLFVDHVEFHMGVSSETIGKKIKIKNRKEK